MIGGTFHMFATASPAAAAAYPHVNFHSSTTGEAPGEVFRALSVSTMHCER